MAANNMISYSQHIWNDMRNIIQMIIDEHGKDFESFNPFVHAPFSIS